LLRDVVNRKNAGFALDGNSDKVFATQRNVINND